MSYILSNSGLCKDCWYFTLRRMIRQCVNRGTSVIQQANKILHLSIWVV